MPLSAKQMEYLAIAWQCFDTEPTIDYEKFKNVAGLASAASARELMRVTKNKLKSEYGKSHNPRALGASIAAANAKTPPSKKTSSAAASTPKSSGGKRGRFAKSTDEDDEESYMEHNSAKKAKTTPAKIGAVGKENGRIKVEPVGEVDDEVEDEHTIV